MKECGAALERRKPQHRMYRRSGDYRPEEDVIQVMTIHARSGLKWPVVAVVFMKPVLRTEDEIAAESKVTYAAATKATHQITSC